MNRTPRVFPHVLLGGHSPSRLIGRHRPLDEDCRQLDEFVRQQAAPDDSGVVMIKLSRCDRNAGTATVEDRFRHHAEIAGVDVALEVPAHLVEVVTKSRGCAVVAEFRRSRADLSPAEQTTVLAVQV